MSESPRIRLLVVDDDPLVRGALTLMLDGAEGIDVVADAGDGSQVREVLDSRQVDVVVMDLRMPRMDGIEATRRVRARTDPPEVLVLTTFDADENVLAALRAGAAGFLLKDTEPERVVEAVRRVAAGEPVFSVAVLRGLLDRARTRADSAARARRAVNTLTVRERDVAREVSLGASNAEIARTLGMSIATVKAHISRMLSELGLGNRTQLALLVHDADG
ncbi:response regulator transcription factor [Ruania halotolerans]|uniref:response regulator transcription factor n=1 Tax=Ruania halotolerans TaxID=2897773 RepID=UPI001E591345|nr:response regulator transcription factor [Ruania halotolerans]UFU05779.1 response regulator transcription factor [Ruania halotolerans]